MQIELSFGVLPRIYTNVTNAVYRILTSFKTWLKNSLGMAQKCRNMFEW